MECTSWDAGIRSKDNNYLEHYGTAGMKWGVRKYQNEDGSLTPLGQKHYGSGQHMSAGKLQRHYNRADQVYANAIGAKNLQMKKAFKYGKKATERGNRLQAKGKNPMTDRKTQRLFAKANTKLNEAKKFENDAKSAESLQWRLLGKAKEMGYTVSSKPVKRLAITGQMKAAQILGQAAGGIIGSMAVGGAYLAKNRKALTVGGSKVKVRKYGDGSINIANSQAGANYLSKKQVDYARKQANPHAEAYAERLRKMGYSEAAINRRLGRK